MRISDTRTPVVVLHCEIGALAIMRTLGYLGVAVYGVSHKPEASALRSRYCRKGFLFPFDKEPPERFVEFLLGIRQEFSTNPILIATSDETAITVARHYDALAKSYLIGQNQGEIVPRLADKMTMFDLVRKHAVPSPHTELPRSIEEARECSKRVRYPVMLKGAMGNRLYERTRKKMVVVNDAEELLTQYQELQDPVVPNLMVQELIPGGDDQVYIFNGYFDANSDCLAPYTGRKIRQFPIHVGCASLGECCWVQEVSDITTKFMKEIGYRGVLDIGYRKDPRDQQYKVLDINPRVGQAFRLFVSDNNLDVVRAMYLDLTGQPVPTDGKYKEGRRWMIEDYDVTSAFKYFREGSLTFGEWVRSFWRLEEGAWFSVRDPVPFLLMLVRLGKQTIQWLGIWPAERVATREEQPVRQR
jgi:predicted ATP-grasp superfamily ATP-dependent carboligase